MDDTQKLVTETKLAIVELKRLLTAVRKAGVTITIYDEFKDEYLKSLNFSDLVFRFSKTIDY